MLNKVPLDTSAYVTRSRHGPCFICELVKGNPEYHHHVVYEDSMHIVFLNKYPTLHGYVLVAPRQHLEQVVGDLPLDEYVAMQKLIYCVARAVQVVTKPERIYILSLGSQQANCHIHWHIAPLPPNTPYELQQFEALKFENGVLRLSEAEMAALAGQIRSHIHDHA